MDETPPSDSGHQKSPTPKHIGVTAADNRTPAVDVWSSGPQQQGLNPSWRWTKVHDAFLGVLLMIISTLHLLWWERVLLYAAGWVIVMHLSLTVHDGLRKNRTLWWAVFAALAIFGAVILRYAYISLRPTTTGQGSPTVIPINHVTGIGIELVHGQYRLEFTDPARQYGGTPLWKVQIVCVALPKYYKHEWPMSTTFPTLRVWRPDLVIFPGMKYTAINFTCASPAVAQIDDAYFVVGSAVNVTAPPAFAEAELIHVDERPYWEHLPAGRWLVSPGAHNCCYAGMKKFLLEHPFPYRTPDTSQ